MLIMFTKNHTATFKILLFQFFFMCSFNRLAVSSFDTRIYFRKTFSVLWPVIFIKSMVGKPSRYKLVANDLLAVWLEIHENSGFSGSFDSRPFSTSPAVSHAFLTYSLNFWLDIDRGRRWSFFSYFLKISKTIGFAGIITNSRVFWVSIFMYNSPSVVMIFSGLMLE